MYPKAIGAAVRGTIMADWVWLEVRWQAVGAFYILVLSPS